MDRRRFLGTIAAGISLLGGCTTSGPVDDGPDAGDERDTDGDGVADDEDYAPTDPSVQRKSDLVGSASPTTEGTTVITITP